MRNDAGDADAVPDGRDRTAWFAHHQLAFIAAAIPVAVAGDLTGSLALQLTGYTLLWIFIVGHLAGLRHSGLLCPTCLAAMPDDAPVRAQRRAWALRLRHWHARHPYLPLLVVLAVVAADVATDASPSVYLLWPWFALDAWAQRLHDRVAPWCPYCRGGDDGGPVPEPAPDPTGRGQLDRTR